LAKELGVCPLLAYCHYDVRPGTATIEVTRLAAHPKLKVELSAIAVVEPHCGLEHRRIVSTDVNGFIGNM